MKSYIIQEVPFSKSPACGQSITCRACGLTSYHAQDVELRYCGHCHVFHEDLALWALLHPDQTRGRLWREIVEQFNHTLTPA